jgi:hypothetical protein
VLTTRRLGLLASAGVVAAVAWWSAACAAQAYSQTLFWPDDTPPGPGDAARVTPPSPFFDRLRTADDVLAALGELRKQQKELQAKQDDLATQVNHLKGLLRQKLDEIEKRMKELNAGDDTPAPPQPPPQPPPPPLNKGSCTSY